MRRIWPVLALVLLGVAVDGKASAETHAVSALTAPSPGDARFELFGTSFCYLGTQPSTGCDIPLPERFSMVVSPPPDTVRRIKIFGISFCSELRPTGPACDVVWVPPEPMSAWRDPLEVRLLAAQSFQPVR